MRFLHFTVPDCSPADDFFERISGIVKKPRFLLPPAAVRDLKAVAVELRQLFWVEDSFGRFTVFGKAFRLLYQKNIAKDKNKM